jgi:putative methyltransferase (TIGR04325 family)
MAEFTECESWEAALALSTGYQEPALVERMLGQFRSGVSNRVRRNNEVRKPGLEISERQLHLLSAWVITVGRLPRVSVADVGGGNGYFFDFLLSAIGRSQTLSWTVFESDKFAKAYSEFGDVLGIKFLSSSAPEKAHAKFDVALFSCVLQYLEDPTSELDSYESGFAIIMRMPVIPAQDDVVFLQSLQSPDYGTASWPIRFFAKEKFEQSIASKWDVLGTMQDSSESVPWMGEQIPMSTYVLRKKI